jgi:probable addiction module antidote protein
VAEYLTAALETTTPTCSSLRSATSKARGISAVAERVGLGRESLSKGIGARSQAALRHTVVKVLHSFGVKLTVSAA